MDWLSLKGYLDLNGVVIQWPAKLSKQIAIVHYIIQDIDPIPLYTEQEINTYIQSKTTLEDYVVIRRHLVDVGILKRTANWKTYKVLLNQY